MLTLEIGSRLLTVLLAAVFAVLVIYWWGYRSRVR